MMSPASLKAQGYTAEEAKARGCSGVEIYALCAQFETERVELISEGLACVTPGGKFGGRKTSPTPVVDFN